MAPPWKGSIWDDAVAVRGVRGTLSIVVGQLSWVWHGNGYRHVILADQIWLAVNVVTKWII